MERLFILYRTKVLLLFACLFCIPTLEAQDFIAKVQHFGIEEGLSHRDVQCIHQDRQGFMWFGTKYGLNRFDGIHFKWFTKENNGLQSNEINHILEDVEGRMWLIYTGSYFVKAIKSIDIFDPKTEKVESFEEAFGNQAPFSQEDVLSFNRNDEGHLVFLTRDNRLVTYDGRFQSIQISLNAHLYFLDLYWSPTGLFWMAKGLYLKEDKIYEMAVLAFDSKGKEVRRFVHPNYEEAMIYDLDEKGNVKYIANSAFKAFFFQIMADGTQEADSITARAFQKWDLGTIPNIRIGGVKKQGPLLWESFRDKFQVFDLEGKMKIQGGGALDKIALVTDIFFDKAGQTWVSTQFGIYRIQLKANHFSKILNNYQGITHPIRNMVVDGENNLWLVEEARIRNLWKVNLKSGAVSQANNSTRKEKKLPFSYTFYTLIKSKTGQLYYSNYNNLIKFDPKTYKYTVLKIGELNHYIGRIWTLYEDEYGKIWYTSDLGVIGFWDGEKAFWLPPLDSLLPVNYIYQFLLDQNGKTWLASDGGLFVLDTKKGEITGRYWSGGSGENYFPFDNIYHIHEDDDGSFWLGTGGTGLVHWLPPPPPDPLKGMSKLSRGEKGQPDSAQNVPRTLQSHPFRGLGGGGKGGNPRWRQFTKTDGLSNNTIYAVYEDDYGNLWLSSDYGIMRFDKKTHRIKAYLETDGITHNEFNRISHYQAEDGTIFFGGLNGATAFNPKNFQGDSSAVNPPLVITDYQQYDGEGKLLEEKKTELLQNSSIVLQPTDRFFRLEFELLTYHDVDKNRYAYKVEGVDADWVYQKESTIRFSRMSYGDHLLRIKGQGANGQWSKNELTINVSVLKPFYLKTGFLVLSLLILLILGQTYYKWRTSQLKKRQMKLECLVEKRTEELQEDKQIIEKDKQIIERQAEALRDLDKLKSRFFANVSHELRTPLTLILGPLSSVLSSNELSVRNHTFLLSMQENSKKLLRLISEILDLSKLESGKLELQTDTVALYPLLRRLIASFESYAQKKQLDFSWNCAFDKNLQLKLDASKFEVIFNNLLSNAFKFTPAGGKIQVHVEDLAHSIHLEVRDTGSGIHPDDLPHIFDRFYQTDRPEAAAEGGTGIGLALCMEFSKLFNGKLWVESELDRGSAFFFEFPKTEVIKSLPTETVLEIQALDQTDATAVHTPEPNPPLSATPAKDENKATLLIVEDNPDLREYLETLLAEKYHILTAENGRAALEMLSLPTLLPPDPLKDESGFASGKKARDGQPTPKPDVPRTLPPHPFRDERAFAGGKKGLQGGGSSADLIISDIMMPVMDGFQLLEKLKNDDRWRHLPVIMLTARAEMSDKLKALRIGVDDYLVKPFEEEELLVRTENLLKNYEGRKEFLTDNEAEKGQPTISEEDENWLKEYEKYVRERLTDDLLSIPTLATAFAMSESTLLRQLKRLTGLSSLKYLQELRLNEARLLLESRNYNSVAKVAVEVGYADIRTFSRNFKNRFGKLPSDYLKNG